MTNKDSFASADVNFPVKLISNRKVLDMLSRKELKPIHLQINPTNRCNLSCSFCSCKGVDRHAELSLENIEKVISSFDSLQAVTITGGGEPLMHKNFCEVINCFKKQNIEVGLVTNGLLLPRFLISDFDGITWIRISLSVESINNNLLNICEPYIYNVKTDWAFSFVCGKDVESDFKVIKLFLDKYEDKITHFRIVNDILNPDDRVLKLMNWIGPDGNLLNSPKIIWQERNSFFRGHPKCRLAVLKPVITADGDIYPCCGTQYALNNFVGNYPPQMKIGTIDTLESIKQLKYFNGSICDKCYYTSYNTAIDKFFNDNIKHEAFI